MRWYEESSSQSSTLRDQRGVLAADHEKFVAQHLASRDFRVVEWDNGSPKRRRMFGGPIYW